MSELESPAGFLGELAKLIAIDTVSPMSDAGIDRCEAYLTKFGFVRVRPGLFALGDLDATTWLYTHIDTKPAVPADRWVTNPWELTTVGDKYYGLGVSDSKFQLLTALSVADPRRHCVIVDTCEETDGCADAAAAVADHQPDTLVVCDGSAVGEFDVFNGLVGQIDGYLEMDTGEARRHPARTDGDVLGLISEVAQRVARLPAKFILTGLTAEESVRSLSLQRAELRFDLRFAGADRAEVMAFVAGHKHRLRHSVLEPIWGREPIVLDDRVSPDPAPFSTRFGGEKWTPPRRCLVVAGGEPDNRNHQPNEFVRARQLGAYRDRLGEVLRRLDADQERDGD